MSDRNNKHVEPLRDVKFISLTYAEDNEDGDSSKAKAGGSHNQKGSFVDLKGESHPVDDVWFVET